MTTMWTDSQVAEYLGIAPKTLRNWALTGDVPPHYRLSRGARRWDPEDVRAWLAQRRVEPVARERA